MIRFLAGVVVGTLGGMYLLASLLPATREERPRDPLPQRTIGGPVHEYRSPYTTYTA